MPNIFDDPKSIKTWAIKLANACGGQKVEKSIVLTSLNTKRLAELLDEFVQDHNEKHYEDSTRTDYVLIINDDINNLQTKKRRCLYKWMVY